MLATHPAEALAAMHSAAPLVQCITHYVAMNVAANALLAVGASPAMLHAAEEAGEFAAVADALTISIGTLSPTWVEGMIAAIDSAQAAGRPWVFDPVALQASTYRRDVAAQLLKRSPTIVRGNASEILALAGDVIAAGMAVVLAICGTTDPQAAARAIAKALKEARQ